MSVLVCGGAGYIGSHVVWALKECGKDIVVIDELSSGHRKSIDFVSNFYQGSIGDRILLDKIFKTQC